MTSVLAARHPWQRGYAIVGGWQLALAVCFLVTRRLWPPVSSKGASTSANDTRASNIATLKLRAVWLSVAVFFVYTGIEAAAGTWAYSLFTEARGVSMMKAGAWVSIYWGGLTAGRLISGMAAAWVPERWLVRWCIIGIAVGAGLIWSNVTSEVSFFGWD
jgi:fucose permease